MSIALIFNDKGMKINLDICYFFKRNYWEVTEVEYSSYESADSHRNEWEEIWLDYLDDQG
jgi:hypothetical protein